VIRYQRSGLKVLWILNGIKLSMWGLYLDVPDGTRKCGIDFSILRNAPLNHYDHYRAFLFFDEKNNPVKYLLFEGMIYGFEQINKKYSCGTTKQNAVFRLWRFKKDQFFRIQFAN